MTGLDRKLKANLSELKLQHNKQESNRRVFAWLWNIRFPTDFNGFLYIYTRNFYV